MTDKERLALIAEIERAQIILDDTIVRLESMSPKKKTTKKKSGRKA